jgi:hypothetical protein
MFAIKSLSKYLFGASKENIVELPQGQLYIVRPHSVKGYSELIFKDSAAFIRRTAQEFQYQLVIQRAYEEGEELDEEDGQEGSGAFPGPASDKDERVFLLDEDLRLRVDLSDTGETILAWRDLSGDQGDLFEFVCDSATRPEAAAGFELVAVQCQYEQKYKKPHEGATDEELREFEFEDEPAIPDASPTPSPSVRSPELSPSPIAARFNDSPATPSRHSDRIMARDSTKKAETPAKVVAPVVAEPTPTKAPTYREAPTSREVLASEHCELHLFDFTSGTFVLQDEQVHTQVTEIGQWKYWLQVSGSKQDWLGQEVVPDINPVFNFEYLSFIFNHYTDEGSAYSWLLKFKDRETEERFQEGLMQALWEHQNEAKWGKAIKDAERDYVLDAFNDLVIQDSKDDEREAAAAEEDEEDEEEYDDTNYAQRSEEYDEDESEDEVETLDNDGNVNSQLAVGAKVDRSFVVRGDKIGVFKHTPDNHLEFSTAISQVATPKGKKFAPKKVMLHMEDRDMVMQDSDNPNSLYRMDLEYGKIVDEWKVHDDIPVNIFAPENKFAQTTGEQTFLGLSKNAMYRIDPSSSNTSARTTFQPPPQQKRATSPWPRTRATFACSTASASKPRPPSQPSATPSSASTSQPTAAGSWPPPALTSSSSTTCRPPAKTKASSASKRPSPKTPSPSPAASPSRPRTSPSSSTKPKPRCLSRPRASTRAKAPTKPPSSPPLDLSSSPGR